MSQVVSITSQGQLTIPKNIRDSLNINGAIKAVVEVVDEQIIVKPKLDFWALRGIAKGKIKLTDEQLRAARRQFEKEWADPA